MYSTVKGTGWKSSQFIYLKSSFLYKKYNLIFYGMKRRKEKEEEKETLSYLPMLASSIYYKLSKILNLKRHNGYILGEKIFGYLFSKKIKKENADILICKPRPLNIIKNFNGKIILEYGETHPIFMKNKIEHDYSRFNITKKNQYIYNDPRAIKNSLEAIEHAHSVILLSEESKKTFTQFYDRIDKFKVISFPTNISKEIINQKKEKKIVQNSKTTYICTAFHSFVKGTHLLLEAWKKLDIENVELLIAGPLNPDMSQYVNENGPFKNVKFLGKVNINHLYNSIEKGVGVSLSHAEGYSRATQEYLEYGFPVIITQICSLDQIRDGIEGIIIDVNNEKKIIDAIKKMNEFDYYLYSRNNALSCIEELAIKNNVDTYTSRIDTLIKEILNENKYTR